MTSGFRYGVKIPKSFLFLFAIVQFFFGYECGLIDYFKSKFQFMFQLLNLTVTATLIMLSLIPFWEIDTHKVLYSLYFAQYIGYVLVFFTSNYNICKFLRDLFSINLRIPLRRLNKYGIVAAVNLIVVILVHVVINRLYCYYFQSRCHWLRVPTVIIYLPSFTVEAVPIVQALILQCIRMQIENLKVFAKTENGDIRNLQTLYKEIADCNEKISPLFCKLTLINLFTNTPKLMIILWFMLQFILIDFNIPKLMIFMSLSVFIVVNISITPVFTEMVKYQVKCVRILLVANKIKGTVSAKNKLDVSNCLLYMEERGIADKAWDVIPLDMDLTYNTLSFCVTYLIVIIQLSHVYE